MASSLVKKRSKIHGNGIFMTSEIKKGSVFYEVPLDQTLDKSKPSAAHIGNRWVWDEKVLNYVNHSCEPNAILDLSGRPVLIARKNIKIGDEITVDYDRTEKGGEQVPCNCQSKNCRKYFLRIQ